MSEKDSSVLRTPQTHGTQPDDVNVMSVIDLLGICLHALKDTAGVWTGFGGVGLEWDWRSRLNCIWMMLWDGRDGLCPSETQIELYCAVRYDMI